MTHHQIQVLAILAALIALPSVAQVTWPEWNPPMMPSPSRSPVQAALPADIVVTAPPSDLPQAKARWSGRWNGWACLEAVCDTKLAVERVTAEGAAIVYVFGSAQIRSNPQRLEAKFVGDELHGTLASGSRVAYRMRADGTIEFLFLPRSGNPVGGVLVKE